MPGRIVLKKQSKYRNVRTLSHGIWFQSKREAARYAVLRGLEIAGEIKALRRQVRYELYVKDVEICAYIADFAYFDKDGKEIVEDAKGYRTLIYKMKKKLMLACFGITVREV